MESSLEMLRTLTAVVSAMEEGVSSRDPAVRGARITDLAKLIETVYDDDAAMLGLPADGYLGKDRV